MISWMISIRGFDECSAMMFWAKRTLSSAAVCAPSVILMGHTSLSIVFGRPTTSSSRACVRRWRARSPSGRVVSSPPIVCSTSTPSAVSWWAATSSGSSPSFTRPRFTASATFGA